jgi:hypothetical protein
MISPRFSKPAPSSIRRRIREKRGCGEDDMAARNEHTKGDRGEPDLGLELHARRRTELWEFLGRHPRDGLESSVMPAKKSTMKKTVRPRGRGSKKDDQRPEVNDEARRQSEVKLRALAAEMRTIPTEGDWYALTLTATADGLREHSWQSSFVGFTKDRPRRELRGPSLVDPQKMAALWADLGMPCWVVRNRVQLSLYFRLGGTCLAVREVAESVLADWTQPMAVGVVAAVAPPKSIALATAEELQHAPTPRLRAQVLKRDDYRCLACGRRPATNTDIELHVHHVAPFSEGGLTTKSNLITLCHTCHKGLEPHREPKMWELLSATERVVLIPEPNEDLRSYQDGVKRHRELVTKFTRKREDEKRSRPSGA